MDGRMALIPPETAPGDAICILFVIFTPLILRQLNAAEGVPSEERFELVGECYVHGAMGVDMDWTPPVGRPRAFVLI
jgi:hypothetical protein